MVGGARVRVRRTAKQIATARRRSEAAHARHILKTYGITAQEYQAIYEFQDSRCYICRFATGRYKRLAVDHCHATGVVRGLLCKFCNRLLGVARDSVEFFERAAEYLRNPPAFDVIGQRRVPSEEEEGGSERTQDDGAAVPV